MSASESESLPEEMHLVAEATDDAQSDVATVPIMESTDIGQIAEVADTAAETEAAGEDSPAAQAARGGAD